MTSNLNLEIANLALNINQTTKEEIGEMITEECQDKYSLKDHTHDSFDTLTINKDIMIPNEEENSGYTLLKSGAFYSYDKDRQIDCTLDGIHIHNFTDNNTMYIGPGSISVNGQSVSFEGQGNINQTGPGLLYRLLSGVGPGFSGHCQHQRQRHHDHSPWLHRKQDQHLHTKADAGAGYWRGCGLSSLSVVSVGSLAARLPAAGSAYDIVPSYHSGHQPKIASEHCRYHHADARLSGDPHDPRL